MASFNRVVLAYSGGLDTSAILAWLRETYDCEVHCFVGDVGQGEEELAGVEEKAAASGAASCHVVDLRQQFVEEFVWPTVMSGAIYEGRYLLGTSMARPILGRAQVELARKLGCDAVAHGCTGKGNDQIRFEAAFAALGPDLAVIAPWRQANWTFRSREDLLAYLAERNIPTTSSAKKIYSRDRNLWHISHEGGAIEDPASPPPEDAWMLTASINDAPDAFEDVTIGFEQGCPVSVDGRKLPGHELVETLNQRAGVHGVGRVDVIENRVVGIKSRGLYETPGGTVLFEALRALEEMVLDRQSLRYRQRLGLEFADLVYEGKWFTPVREAIQVSIQSLAKPLTGSVTVRMHKGHATPVARECDHALYREDFATFGPDEVYNQADATGFIRLWTLPERIRAYAEGSA